MKTIYLAFACGNAFLAAMRLYRAYTGALPGGLVTFSNSGAQSLSKKERRADTLYGIFYLAAAIALFIVSFRHS